MSAANSSDAPEATAATVTSGATAVVVARGASTVLRRTLRSVLSQTVLPATVIVVDVQHEPADQSLIRGLDVPAGVSLILTSAARARNFGAAARAALRDFADQVDSSSWIWLLHEDSAPLPDALAHLLQAVEGNETVGIAGAKQVVWGGPDRLIEVGYTTSPAGRRLTGVEPGEIDQGQHDGRDDVLAVGLAGALVRLSVWQQLRGTDNVLGPFRDGLDLCLRIRRSGWRVIVVPTAAVEHAQLSLHGVTEPTEITTSTADRSFGPRLRSWLYVRTVMAPNILWALLPVWYVLCSLPRALWRITVKQPGQALDEIFAPWWLITKFHRILLARHLGARSARIPRRSLRPLFATSRDIAAADRDQRLARAATRARLRRGDELQWAVRLAFARRRRTALAAVILGLGALTFLAHWPQLRAVFRGEVLVGGALLPASGSWSSWWQAIASGWNTQDLGAAAPVDPLMAALAPAMVLTGGDMAAAVALLLGLSILLAGLGAWFASGALTESLAVRMWAVVLWVSVPSYFLSAAHGRLGAVLVHATLPWFALALAHAVGLVSRRSYDTSGAEGGADPASGPAPHRTSLVSVGAAGLFLALLAAAAPVLLVPLCVVVGIAGFLARRRGSSGRGGWWLIPLPAIALLAPLLVRVVVTWSAGGWRMLIADPGGQVSWSKSPWWQQPLGVMSDVGLDGPAADLTWLLYAIPSAIVIGLALAGLLRQDGRGAVARLGWVLAGIGFATAGIASNTVVSVDQAEPVTGWPGPGLSLATLALMLPAMTALSGLGTAARRYSLGWRQLSVVALAVVVTLPPMVQAAIAARTMPVTTEVAAQERNEVPAIAQQMQQSGRQARVLALSGTTDQVSYRLLRHDGVVLTQSSAVVAVDRLRTGDDNVAPVVGALIGSSGIGVMESLIELGIGAVLLDDATGPSAGLADRLDTATGLQRMTQGRHDVLWRVTTPQNEEYQVSWARIVDDPELALPAPDLAIDTTIPSASGTRTLHIAERAAPGWRATLNGQPLEQIERDNGLLGFAVGPQAGNLQVAYERSSKLPWLALQGGVFLVFALLALPVRRRAGGAR